MAVPEQKIEDMLQRIERGEVQFKATDPEMRFLARLILPKSKYFRPEVRKRLIKCGAMKGRKIKTENAESRIERILPLIECGRVKYSQRDPRTKFLANYVTPGKRSFRPELRERLTKCGALKPRKNIKINLD